MAHDTASAGKSNWVVDINALLSSEEIQKVVSDSDYTPTSGLKPKKPTASAVSEATKRGVRPIFVLQTPDAQIEHELIVKNLVKALREIGFKSKADNFYRTEDAAVEDFDFIISPNIPALTKQLLDGGYLSEDTLVISSGIDFGEMMRQHDARVILFLSRDRAPDMMAMERLAALEDPDFFGVTIHQNFWLFVAQGWKELDRNGQEVATEEAPAEVSQAPKQLIA